MQVCHASHTPLMKYDDLPTILVDRNVDKRRVESVV